MNVREVIQSRRTIKSFKSTPIDRSKIISWLEDASFAPNHRMTEPWEILFIGPETRKELNHKRDFGDAPTVFAILSKKGKSVVEREENAAATACFIQNFMLIAWAENVGTFWSSIGNSKASRSHLGVTDEFDVIGVIAVGYPEETPEAKARVPIHEKIIDLP